MGVRPLAAAAKKGVQELLVPVLICRKTTWRWLFLTPILVSLLSLLFG